MSAHPRFTLSYLKNGRVYCIYIRFQSSLLVESRNPSYQHLARCRSTSSSKGKKKNESGVAVSDVVIELARTGKLTSGTAYEDTAPPLNLFSAGLPSSEMNKYKLAMRVASAAVTEDQEKVFRAAEINDAELIRNAKALDEGCRKWIAKALGRKKVGKLTAQVLGLGANARNVPAGEWPKPTGGLFGSIRRYIS